MKRILSGAVLLLVVAMVATAGMTPLAATAADASPPPTTAPLEDLIVSGDPRSDGEGPGIVGSPLAILVGVVLLGLLTAAITVTVVRLRGNP